MGPLAEMAEQPRYLITTPDERTWYYDKPVIFLGEWCRLYGRQSAWGNLNAKIVPPYGWGVGQKDADFSYVQRLYEQLLVELSDALNQYHGTNHSLRYWRILIGPWLHTFTNILFNRWATIQLAMREFTIAGTVVLEFPVEQLIPNSQNEFERNHVSHQWNHHIFGRILSGWTSVPCERIAAHALVEGLPNEHCIAHIGIMQRLKRVLAKGLYAFSCLLSRPTDAFLITSYLPHKQDFLLQLALGQIPKLWRTETEPKLAPDLKVREQCRLAHEKHQGFEQCIRALIVEQIPVLYLEGYQALNLAVSNMPWPAHPKVIFTSNSAHGDEIFKAWAAGKTELGFPYVMAQHGGLYGTGKYPNQFEIREVATVDRYLTWGWTDNNPKHYPCVALKLIGQPIGTWDPAGGLLQVTMLNMRYTRDPWDIATQQAEYQEDQFQFAEQLPEFIRAELTVRLSRSAASHGYPRDEIWKVRHPKVRLDDGNSSIETLMRRSRLFVYTYNSTGFLETLGRNIPTIMFWNPKHWELRPSAQQYFDRLRQVGILHDTPESAAEKIASVWESVEEWWGQNEVQEARVYFCNRFARMPENPIQEMKVALQSVMKNESVNVV